SKNNFIELEILSPVSDLYIMYTGSYNFKEMKSGEVNLKNNRAVVKIPRAETLRGNLQFNFETVFENSHYSVGHHVKATSKKSAGFTVQTFRNKMEPGTDETW